LPKPESAVSEDALWNKAIASLKHALENEGIKYHLDEGGGAFYGPKIDIKIKDALRREWQMSTIQFDFNEPERFDMKYIGEDGKEHRPFMVHRALLGSIERFFGVLIEHYAGSFPLWLAPVQAAVLPISQNHYDYAKEIAVKLVKEGIRAEFDERNEKIGYKIRDWETNKIPYAYIRRKRKKFRERFYKTAQSRQYRFNEFGRFHPKNKGRNHNKILSNKLRR
jgi:threonyl-tRNA synthetase